MWLIFGRFRRVVRIPRTVAFVKPPYELNVPPIISRSRGWNLQGRRPDSFRLHQTGLVRGPFLRTRKISMMHTKVMSSRSSNVLSAVNVCRKRAYGCRRFFPTIPIASQTLSIDRIDRYGVTIVHRRSSKVGESIFDQITDNFRKLP